MATAIRELTDDESFILAHISRFGSDGYPIRKQGRKWFWEMREFHGLREGYVTKRAATASFEGFLDDLRGVRRALVVARAQAVQS